MLNHPAAALLAAAVLLSGCAQYEKYVGDVDLFESSDSDDASSVEETKQADAPVDQSALDDAASRYQSRGYQLAYAGPSERIMSYSGPINDSIECLSPGGENYRIMPKSRRDKNGVEQRFQLDQRVEIKPSDGFFYRTQTDSYNVLSATIHSAPISPAARMEVVTFDSDSPPVRLKSGLQCRAR